MNKFVDARKIQNKSNFQSWYKNIAHNTTFYMFTRYNTMFKTNTSAMRCIYNNAISNQINNI